MPYSYRSSRTSSARRLPQSRRPNNIRRNRGPKNQYIDPNRFIARATVRNVDAYEAKHTFDGFALDDLLKRNLALKGYATPSPIQDQAIPPALEGKDIIGLAGTGTGKTAAFALPVLQRLITDRNARALIIAPTRELAQQIDEECRTMGRGIQHLTGALLIGGTGMGQQLRNLKLNPQIVIGTPGRIKDHMQRNTLRLHNFNMVVLDEVDRMLDMGFINDVREIVGRTDPNRQSFFFSATMDGRVRELIETITRDPVTIAIQSSSASENVHQDIIKYQGASEKLNLLHDLLLKDEVAKAIVFEETQRNVERLNKELQLRGFTSEAIHGGKSQGQRQRALSKFKQSEVNILVATDVAARGLDVADITHVINFSVPKVYDDYIHRIGRAGRAGEIGYALTFVAH